MEIQNKIIEEFDSLKKAISGVFFGRKPDFLTSLGNLISTGKAGGTPSSMVSEYYEGNIPFLSISDITRQGKYIDWTDKHISEAGLKNSSAWLVPSNSLILSMYASVGLVCINRVSLTTSQAMFSMVLKQNEDLDYIYYFLDFFRESHIHRLLETGTQSNINADTVRAIKIPFYNNRAGFVKEMLSIEKCLNNEKKKLFCLIQFKKYLLSNLFI